MVYKLLLSLYCIQNVDYFFRIFFSSTNISCKIIPFCDLKFGVLWSLDLQLISVEIQAWQLVPGEDTFACRSQTNWFYPFQSIAFLTANHKSYNSNLLHLKRFHRQKFDIHDKLASDVCSVLEKEPQQQMTYRELKEHFSVSVGLCFKSSQPSQKMTGDTLTPKEVCRTQGCSWTFTEIIMTQRVLHHWHKYRLWGM